MFFIPDSFIDNLISEDLHIFDLTSEALRIGGEGEIECFPKRACVVAGLEEAARVFRRVGARAELFRKSGDWLDGGTICMKAQGSADQLHAVYKVAQNIMEYSSGIATRCAEMLRNARRASPGIEVSVTRKHFPGSKLLSLKAALAGGASPHRLGLSDSILVFDQHRVFTGGSEGFIQMIRKMAARFPERKIAVEASDPDEAFAFASAGADAVQCERFSSEELCGLVRRLRDANLDVKILAAGGINADNAYDYAASGVDVLVTSWVYFGKPEDIKMKFTVKPPEPR
ncbi:MAG: ModD protein [Synergistaceae bacterium]|jgi:molybdenum transport protein|nr:ModD protein [Synergistaceae bacterium]